MAAAVILVTLLGGELQGRIEETGKPGNKLKSLTSKAGLVTTVLHTCHVETF